MGQKMKKPPIFYTIGHIQFNTVLGMGKFISDIQEALRGDFPDFQAQKIANIQIRIAGEGSPAQAAIQEQWQFTDLKRTSGYLLRPNALVFHTTAYEDAEHFLQKVVDGISVVNHCAGLSYVDSVAIRTLDAVIPAPDLNVRDYLNPAVRGLSRGLDGQLKHSVSESLWEIPPNGVLISRVAIVKGTGTLAIPMDLFPLSLELKPELKEVNVEHALLDNDRQEKERFVFDLEEIQKRLLIVKKGATEAFHKAVSAVALERWN
jgi:uncharacterized protein (TIGR04255 family)